MSTLEIKDLRVTVEGKEVIKGLDLTIRTGEIHAIMGPNGSGKSSLCKVVMGHPAYEVTGGSVTFDGEDVLAMSPDKRAQVGLFLSFQYPRAIPGLTMSHFLRSAYNAVMQAKQRPRGKGQGESENAGVFRPLSVMKFAELLKAKMKELHIALPMAERAINEGFSGGEMKKTEMLQMALLEPRIVMLDETDSGLDVDALRLVCSTVKSQYERTGMGVLLITHYNRILDYITPHYVHVMKDGTILRSGGPELARAVEEKGYADEFEVPSEKPKTGKKLKVIS